MGCNCKKNKINSSNNKSNSKPIKSNISLNVLTDRRDICRKCKYSTKRKKEILKSNPYIDALSPMSVCLKSGKNLTKALKNKKFACPIGKFSSV